MSRPGLQRRRSSDSMELRETVHRKKPRLSTDAPQDQRRHRHLRTSGRDPMTARGSSTETTQRRTHSDNRHSATLESAGPDNVTQPPQSRELYSNLHQLKDELDLQRDLGRYPPGLTNRRHHQSSMRPSGGPTRVTMGYDAQNEPGGHKGSSGSRHSATAVSKSTNYRKDQSRFVDTNTMSRRRRHEHEPIHRADSNADPMLTARENMAKKVKEECSSPILQLEIEAPQAEDQQLNVSNTAHSRRITSSEIEPYMRIPGFSKILLRLHLSDPVWISMVRTGVYLAGQLYSLESLHTEQHTHLEGIDDASVAVSASQWLTEWLSVRPNTQASPPASLDYVVSCEPLSEATGEDWSHFWTGGARSIFVLIMGLRKCYTKDAAGEGYMSSMQWSSWVSDIQQAFRCMIQIVEATTNFICQPPSPIPRLRHPSNNIDVMNPERLQAHDTQLPTADEEPVISKVHDQAEPAKQRVMDLTVV